jgi:hypothetical protein
MQGIDFVQRRRREEPAGWRGKKIVVIVEPARLTPPIELMRAFRDAEITYMWFPPHLTHVMQGVDVGKDVAKDIPTRAEKRAACCCSEATTVLAGIRAVAVVPAC